MQLAEDCRPQLPAKDAPELEVFQSFRALVAKNTCISVLQAVPSPPLGSPASPVQSQLEEVLNFRWRAGLPQLFSTKRPRRANVHD
jgi:hypothetical protein